jgi:hypothetical protein
VLARTLQHGHPFTELDFSDCLMGDEGRQNHGTGFVIVAMVTLPVHSTCTCRSIIGACSGVYAWYTRGFDVESGQQFFWAS